MESQNHNKQNPLWRETNLSPFANPQQGAGKLRHYVPKRVLVREKEK
ncbi:MULTISPECIES: hypothetical protein [unclassified Variovorax]|nr:MULTISPECIES: hypothetical protein [unclassified Variovorax]